MEETYAFEYDGMIDPALLSLILLCSGIIALISIISLWLIFKKAGRPGWASLIPVYNTYTLIKMVGKSGWWLLLLLIPLVNIVIAIKLLHYLSKSFGKGTGFTLGLLFLPVIFYPVLAFGPAKYLGPYGDPAAFAAYQAQHRFEFENALK